MAPAVASSLAAIVLLLLVFGSLLRYPGASQGDPDAAALEAQRRTNEALRDQLERLRRTAANTCQPGAGTGAASESQPALLPPSPARTTVNSVAPGQAQPSVSTLAALLEKATVLVVAGDGLGSGFFISDRDIVTNHHVVGDLRDVRVGSAALGGFVPGKVIAVGTGQERGTQDLAVVEIAPKAGTASLQIGVIPERLEPVTAAGYPGAVLETIKDAGTLPEANFTQGILTSRQAQAPAGIGTIIHTAQIGHGNSGGPLVDAGGCAVGVNSWLTVDAAQDVVFSTFFQALDATELRKFLTDKGIPFAASPTGCKPDPTPAAATGSAPVPSAPARP